MTPRSAELSDRYAVQRRVQRIGHEGQERIRSARAVVVGVGALGSAISQQLARAGLGTVVLIDSDRVELGNLHRQVLYDEEDVRRGRFKAEAAAEQLARANREVVLEPVIDRLTEANAAELIRGASVVVDGSDNLTTRFAVNRACVEAEIPWIYGGVAATHGLVLPVVPGAGPCLRCLFEDPPEREEPTAETAGVFGPAPAVIGALEAALAIRAVVGDLPLPPRLLSIDVWTGELDAIAVHRAASCPICHHLR